MIKTVLDNEYNLVNELPVFLRKFKEYKLILHTHEEELKLLAENMKKMVFNQFIETADSEGLMYYERLLKIPIDESLDIDIRRFNVLVRWGGELPYTYKNLVKKLDFLCGKGNYKLTIDNNRYKINITTYFVDEKKKEILLKSLRGFIPANMIITNDNSIRMNVEGEVNIAGATAEYRKYNVTGG